MFNLNRIGILLLLLVVVGTAAGVSCGETPDEAVVAVNTGPTPTRRPPATRRPTRTISPSDALRAAVDAQLGESDRAKSGRRLGALTFDGRTLQVTWGAADNLTVGMALSGIERDAADILQAAEASGIPYESAVLVVTFPLADPSGNVTEEEVVRAAYERATVNGINWDNFSPGNVFNIADELRMHPTLSAAR